MLQVIESVLLTVLSRVAVGNSRVGPSSVIVYSLNLNLIWNKCGRSRHNKLGIVGHSHRSPLAVYHLLPPHHFVVKPRAVGLEARQWLQRGKL